MNLRKFEFSTKELAEQFISAHQSETERRDFIGPMKFATAHDEEGNVTASTNWLVDCIDVVPLEEWTQYEVTPQNPLHRIWT